LWGLDGIGPRCAVLEVSCPGYGILDETTLYLYPFTGSEMNDIYHQSIAVLSELVGRIT
jgi:hypothetical protein